MSLVLSEDQQLLKDSAKSFVDQNAPVSVLRGLRDSRDARGYDQSLWQQMLELGWAGMAIPEAYGGFEFGYGGLGVVLEETGRSLVSSPLIASVLLGASAINVLGSEQQKASLLPQLVSGELLLALAMGAAVGLGAILPNIEGRNSSLELGAWAAAIGMSSSSLIVLLNALRLKNRNLDG